MDHNANLAINNHKRIKQKSNIVDYPRRQKFKEKTEI